MTMEKKFITRMTAAALCLALTATGFSACGKKDAPEPTDAPGTAVTEEAPQNLGKMNPLTGEMNLRDEAIGKRPVAIMVENSPQARPQWGLSKPDIVVEGVVEGGITRMMWLFSDVKNVPKVGPTRSARHDYVELAEGFDAIYVHFGGSSYAYDAINRYGTKDIDGLHDGDAFKRDSSRKVSKEHTAYTSGEMLNSMIAKKNLRTELRKDWKAPFVFAKEKRALPGGACNSVKLAFSENYQHTFTFKDGLYYNHMNKNEMKDANGQTMAVSNVLILYCGVSGVPGSDKHRDWDLKGGKGVYVSNGTYQNIQWSKGTADSPNAPLKLTDENGKPLELNQGKSWIGFVPSTQQSQTVIS